MSTPVDWLDSGEIGPSVLALACTGDDAAVQTLLNTASNRDRALMSAVLAASYVIARSPDADRMLDFLRRMVVASCVED